MATVRVGYRRLYDSMGCRLSDRDDLLVEFRVGSEISAQIYMGPQPRFGIAVVNQEYDRYIIPDSNVLMFKAEFEKDARESSYPCQFFTEVCCWQELEVSAEIVQRFEANDPMATSEITTFAQRDRKPIDDAMSVVVGLIGLRFHPQFVIKLVNENIVIPRTAKDFAFDMHSVAFRTLEEIGLNENGVHYLQSITEQLASAGQDSIRMALLNK